MAALAAPLLVEAGKALLIALGIVVAAGGAKTVHDKIKESEKAKSEPIARAEPRTHAKAETCKCPPEHGSPIVRPTAGWSQISILYQARIGGLPVVPGAITEWLFNGPTFDGFDISQCLLKEAKAHYDQFFNAYGRPLKFWAGEASLITQAVIQDGVVKAAPPARLNWYFMESKSCAYFSSVFRGYELGISVIWQP